MPNTPAKARARIAVLSLTVSLAFILTLITVITRSSFIILLALLVPLALTIPGQLKENSRAFQWLCFVDMFFLVHGILLIFTPGLLYYGVAETLICLSLFFSAIIFIRSSRNTA